MLDAAVQSVFNILANYGFIFSFLLAVSLGVLFHRSDFVEVWAFTVAGVLGSHLYFEDYTCTETGWAAVIEIFCGWDWFTVFFQLELSILYLVIAGLHGIVFWFDLDRKLTHWYYSDDSSGGRDA